VNDRLYRTLSYWLDEPRLHDPSLYVLALPAEYQSQLLVTVFQFQSVCIAHQMLCSVVTLLKLQLLLSCSLLVLTLSFKLVTIAWGNVTLSNEYYY